ncbi:uncharacterized protein LOC122725331 [Dromiciops gliroides]|uniref:uncharacterized protein LOC122725331 n=1 Tax=Dromiciops gliroides TaxID=33562 RepID=UPI001CC62A5A|nr:uncharacterized protein LOC122725331 [Dromiciops gliroides]
MSDFGARRWTPARSLPPLLLCALVQPTATFKESEKMSFLNGTQEDDILLHLDLNIGKNTQLIERNFQSKNLRLLTIYPGESRPRWIIPRKEYKERLSVPDGKSLRIMNLISEDSGCYEAHIKSVSGEIYIEKFNLTVFGTKTTEPNMNARIRWWSLVVSLVSVLVIMLLVGVWFSRPKRDTRENMQPTMDHGDERRLEEGLTSCPNGLQTEDTYEDLPTISTQENGLLMLSRICMPQEHS